MYRPAVHFLWNDFMKEKMISFRVSEAEYKQLKDRAIDTPAGRTKNGNVNLSGYMRNQVLSAAGIRNTALASNAGKLHYEMRKLGVNVNQIARKLNAGIGTEKDVEILHEKIGRIEQLLEQYIAGVDELWQSQNS